MIFCKAACLLALTVSTQQPEGSPVKQLHVLQSADTPLSALEVHPDGTMQFSLHCLQELSTNSPSAQTSGSGQESDSRVLVSPAYLLHISL